MANPWRLFRFRSLNSRFWQGFENSQFYCNLIQNLNDPFDCKVSWKDSLLRALSSSSVPPERRELLKMVLAAFMEQGPLLEAGICCFSSTMDNTLMWSHYADAHRGACLMYDIPAGYFSNKYEHPDSDGFFFVGGSRVYYSDNAFSDWLKTGNLNKPMMGFPVENTVSRIFCSKAKAWKHEQEWRLVTSTPGVLQFEPTHLTQVGFGLLTSDADRKRLAEVAKRNNPSVVLTQAVKSKSDDFKIEYVDV